MTIKFGKAVCAIYRNETGTTIQGDSYSDVCYRNPYDWSEYSSVLPLSTTMQAKMDTTEEHPLF